MGLFDGKEKRNKKMLEDALRKSQQAGNIQKKQISCPRCGKRYTVTFLGPNDCKTCTCGYKIYNR